MPLIHSDGLTRVCDPSIDELSAALEAKEAELAELSTVKHQSALFSYVQRFIAHGFIVMTPSRV